MAQPTIPETYNEPTIMWRMRHPLRGTAYGKIIPARLCTSAEWYIGRVPHGGQEFEEWRQAILWLNAVLLSLKTEGWEEDLDAADYLCDGRDPRRR